MQNKEVWIQKNDDMEYKVVRDLNTSVTRAEVRVFDALGNVIVFGRGTARWNPIDRFDPKIGRQIALGRALAKFGSKLARHYEKLAVSPGEFRARNREFQQIVEVGELVQSLRKHVPTELVVRDTPQESTTAQESPQKDETSLDSIIESNRKKLVGDEQPAQDTLPA